MSLATRQTVERALAAYLATVSLGGKSLADFGGRFEGEKESDPAHPLTVHCNEGEVGEDGEMPEKWDKLTMPAIVVSSSSSTPHLIGYDMCRVEIHPLTSPTEINGPTNVGKRIGWLSAVFDEDRLEEVTTALNAPPSGPDARAVQGLYIIGIVRDGEATSTNGRQVGDVLQLVVHATGDGDA